MEASYAESYLIAQWLFIKGLAICYFIAFWSLHIQVLGLYGSQGILPIKAFLTRSYSIFGKKAYFRFPTCFWWKSTDSFIKIITSLGMGVSLLVFFGFATMPLLFILWFFYLSFVSVGREFLAFQWDILLLEVGFLGIFFTPSPPPFLMVFLFWFLLFRFIFSSGLVKILSGCPEWRSLKAMDVHYETQPLPSRLAYYMHKQPSWISKISCIGVFFFELAVPFLIFGPHWSREIAFCLLIFFQLLIILTGNYAFFNLLTIVMCIPLLPDTTLQSWFGTTLSTSQTSLNPFINVFLTLFATFFIFLNTLQIAALFVPLGRIGSILYCLTPYYLVNSYGLFAWMTTKRYEIIIEGSDDEQDWKTYEFKWKPGDLKGPPRQVAPHQPRLDWQLWFAALSPYRSNPWFIDFLQCLLKGSPTVCALLKKNPFPSHPPRYLRAKLYEYHFSDLKTKKEKGQWWIREELGFYLPTIVEYPVFQSY